MALLRFFKTPKHQQFEYKPRYWDPNKEELQKRLDLIRKTGDGDPEAMKTRISAGLRRQYGSDSKFRSKQNFRSNILLVAVIVVLILLSIAFLSIYLPQIVDMIENNSQM